MMEHGQFVEEVLRRLRNIERQNEEIKKAMATQAQGLTDLQAAVVNLQNLVISLGTGVATAIADLQEQQAEITALQNAQTGDPDPAVEAAAQAINASLASLTTLQTNITAATAGIPGAPAPAAPAGTAAAPSPAAIAAAKRTVTSAVSKTAPEVVSAPGKTVTDKTGTRTVS
jgi:hypothetical protein